jgi:hypothetical protein
MSTASAVGNGVTASITVPAGAPIGDVAYLAVATRPLAEPPSISSGWAAIQQSTAGGSSTDITLSVFARRLIAGDPGSLVTIDLNDLFGGDWVAQIVTVPGLKTPQLFNKVLATLPLTSPHSFGNTVVGGAGTATYEYVITAIDAAGETVASGTQVMNNAPNTLTGSNYVQLLWQPTARATSYNVYGRTPGSPQLLAHVTQPQNVVPEEFFYIYNDTGAAPGVQTPPTQQPTNWLMDGLNLEGDGVALMPERLFTTYASGRLLVFAAGQLAAGNASATVGDPGGTTGIMTTIAGNNKIVLHSAIETLGGAQNVGTRLFTPSDYAAMWTAVGLVLRPSGANGAPTAIAGFDQDAEVGTTVYLDGSQSYDEDGDSLTYTWTQTAGPTVTLSDIHATFPSFTMPSAAVTFRLTATDPSNAQTTDTVTITPIQAGSVKVKNSGNTWMPLP